LRIEIREKPWDLIIIIMLAVLLIGITLTVQTGILQIFLGVTFVVFFPGYVIVSAIFPKAEIIDNIERIALSFGLSIAVIPLIGLILNYTPWGIRLHTMLTSLFVLIISVSIIAWYRRSQLSVEDRFYILISIELPRGGKLARIDKILTILLIFALIFTFCVFFYVITVPKQGERYTEFYILDENRTIENYPNNMTIGQTGTIIVGVTCHEHEITGYTVEIELINLTGERMNMTLGLYSFTLMHNQHNETVYEISFDENGTYKLLFLLYINDIADPYRELYIWINVKQ
jgi:uncharacterized membrane protein